MMMMKTRRVMSRPLLLEELLLLMLESLLVTGARISADIERGGDGGDGGDMYLDLVVVGGGGDGGFSAGI